MIRKSLIIYTPVTVFTVIWGVTLCLYFLNPFQLDEIRNYTWIVIILGLSMVYLGFFTAKLLGDGFVFSESNNDIQEFPFDIEKIKQLIFILTTISLIGKIGSNYLILNEIGSLELYLVEPNYVRDFIKESGLGNTSVNLLAYKFFCYLGSLTPISIILAGAISNLRKTKLLSIYPLIVTAFHSVLTLQRVYFIKSYVIWLTCSYIIIYFYPTLKQNMAFRKFIKRLLLFILISLMFLFIVIFVRSLFSPTTDLEKLYNTFYFYVAGNIYLLDTYLVTDPSPLYGVSLFRSIINWFAGFGILDKTAIFAPHYEFYRIYNTMGNTFTYLRVPYEDFNILGVILVSYIWGWFGFFVMRQYLERFSFMRFGLASLTVLSFFWSFFGFSLVHLTAWVWKLFLLSIVDLILLKRHKYGSKYLQLNS